MKVKYTFHEPGCYICNDLVIQGCGISETRYCAGFPKRKNLKRFRASDPKMTAPSCARGASRRRHFASMGFEMSGAD